MNYSEIVKTDDGSLTLKHPEHGECFHSLGGALLEAKALYIEASGLLNFKSQNRTRPARILDVGLGLGYNAIATIDASLNAGLKLELMSLEIDVELFAKLRSGEAPWQSNWSREWKNFCQNLKPLPDGNYSFASPNFSWKVVLGDAKANKNWQSENQPFDFIWQDPFSPQHNPAMWGVDWCTELRNVSIAGQTCLMTYSVARSTREALAMAGWNCEKIPGRGKKRQWLKAVAKSFSVPAKDFCRD